MPSEASKMKPENKIEPKDTPPTHTRVELKKSVGVTAVHVSESNNKIQIELQLAD